ncbi:MAG: ABC transporter ATP-binding protein [Anaerolineales bacterium]|nr:ABC transporter ATP-binding protein [Anaerolineales bacterium]
MGGQQLEILSKVSIDIQRAEMVAVVGPSGSGKSTLMGLIGGLDSPTSGQVIIDGVDITHLNERALTRMRNEKIGFVFQDYNLVPTLDALENVMLPMQFSRSRRSGAKQRAQDLLAMLGLDKRLHHSYKQLSGGEQQRVVIARALANQPPILLCDEPTGNLDKASTALVIEALFEIREAMGTTIVVVTHSPALAELLDRKIVLVDGKINEQRQ